MGEEGSRTLADAIMEHRDGESRGESLLARQVANDRAVASGYRAIAAAMAAPDMDGLAVLDRKTNRVYITTPNGLVAHFDVVDSESIPLAGDDFRDELISIGETS